MGLLGALLVLVACGPKAQPPVATESTQPSDPAPCVTLEPEGRSGERPQRHWFYDDEHRLGLTFVDRFGFPEQLVTVRYSEDGREAWVHSADEWGRVSEEHIVNDAGAASALSEAEDAIPTVPHKRTDCPREGAQSFEGDQGNLVISGKLMNGVREGLWQVHTAAGWKLREVDYVAGLPAQVRTYFPDGQLYQQGALVDGLRSGTWERFWPSGAQRERGPYARGQRAGVFELWTEGGEGLPTVSMGPPLKHDGRDIQQGWDFPTRSILAHTWAKDRSVTEVEEESGRFSTPQQTAQEGPLEVSPPDPWPPLRHGTKETWHPSGVLAVREEYWLGQPHGTWTYYDRGGRVRPTKTSEATRPVVGLHTSPTSNGALVRAVFEGLPAADAGVRVGDIIATCNGIVPSEYGIGNAVAADNSRTTLTLLRDGETIDVEFAPVLPPTSDSPTDSETTEP